MTTMEVPISQSRPREAASRASTLTLPSITMSTTHRVMAPTWAVTRGAARRVSRRISKETGFIGAAHSVNGRTEPPWRPCRRTAATSLRSAVTSGTRLRRARAR